MADGLHDERQPAITNSASITPKIIGTEFNDDSIATYALTL